jgi:hypothetical protein
MSYDKVELLQRVVNDFHGILIRNMSVPDIDKMFIIPPARLELYMKMRFNVRFFMLSFEDLQQIWMEDIRASEDVTDFITSVTQELEFYLSGVPKNSSTCVVTDALSRAMTSFGSVRNSKPAFDVDIELFDECNSKAETMYNVLTSMPWLKALLLMKLTDANEIITAVMPVPEVKKSRVSA